MSEVSSPELPPVPETISPVKEAFSASPILKGLLLKLLWLPALLPWLLILIYTIQPDGLASVTIIPLFCWVFVGMQLLGPMLLAWKRASFWTAITGWFLFGVFLVPEWRSLVRSKFDPPEVPKDAILLRVITANTGAGKGDVVRTLAKYSPDLILLQESPPAYLLPQLTADLWGPDSSTVSGFDCSIISRGRLTVVSVPSVARFQQAIWEPKPGLKINVVGLRLSPVPVDMTFWDATARSTYRTVREDHRQEMKLLISSLEKIPQPKFTIVGGDFNCPAGDRTEWPLQHFGQDAFRSQGRGWGNTITSMFPFHRIDRIWLSKKFHPVNVRAIRTRQSDHCFVICDFYVLPEDLPASQPPATDPASNSAPQNTTGQGDGQ